MSKSDWARYDATFNSRELCEGAAGGDPEDDHMGREGLLRKLEECSEGPV
jgi:hypothetical protein